MWFWIVLFGGVGVVIIGLVVFSLLQMAGRDETAYRAGIVVGYHEGIVAGQAAPGCTLPDESYDCCGVKPVTAAEIDGSRG